MYINKIIKMKNNKYKIVIDDFDIITYDNVILENDLLYKKSIDKDLYKKILLDTSYYEIYNKTVKYILKRRRSQKEVEKYLSKYDIDNTKKEKVVSKLKDIKLINDIEYCKAYINDKLYLGTTGINKIKKDLLNQNISIEIIDDCIEKIDKDVINNKLESIIIKKIKSNTKYSKYYLKQKVLNEMVNLGYNREDILTIIEENLQDDGDILIKEFNKIYSNLSKKYSGYELDNKIKQKLIIKGFKIEEIDILIKEKTGE